MNVRHAQARFNFNASCSLIVGTLICSILFYVYPMSSQAYNTIYYNDYAQKLAEIGVFKGTGSSFELDREPTRLEGLIMLIRLLGKESDANKLSGVTSVFTDVPDWAQGYVNYAYQNNLTKGIGNQLFGTNNKMNGNAYLTLLLRALGYDDSRATNDFTWSQAIEFAKKVGLLDEELYFKMVSNPFTRDYVAKSSYNTLNQKVKGTNTLLIQRLVSVGAISLSQQEKLNAPIIPNNNTNSNTNTNNTSNSGLSSQEIAKLADAVVYIEVTNYNGSTSSGSGFYITSDGNLATNYHVIKGAKSIKIVENDGQVYTGNVKVLGYDSAQDIAVLDIDRTVKLFLRTGNSDTVQLADAIYTIGSPLRLRNTISDGIISSIRDGFIQISAPISPGSSGGVLLNKQGLAIGITTAIYKDGANLGFAVPINTFLKMPKNLQLTLDQFFNSTNIQKMSFEQFESVVQSKYGTLSLYGESVYFGDVLINTSLSSAENMNVFLHINTNSYKAFLNIVSKDYTAIEKFLSTVCSEVGKYYDKNMSGYLIYSDSYSYYPSAFAKNYIYSESVKYDQKSGLWDVYYPMLYVDLNLKTNKYTPGWGI